MKGTRDHIVRVSSQLFLTKTFKEVTVKVIAREAGVSQGAFFHYFNSKEQLFHQIVNQALASAENAHFSKFSKQSLHAFYHDYIEWFLGGLYEQGLQDERSEEIHPPINQFTIVFDAIKLFPDYRTKLIESQQIELQSWKQIIHQAREQGEIASPMGDEQIARLFIHSSDGIGLRSIFAASGSAATKKELIVLWDHLYESLKAAR